MYLIVGLGNPEEEYSRTRHNMGFNTINKIATQYNIDVHKKKFKGLYGIGNIEGEKVILLKPQTYMNLSGESIKEVINFYQISTKELIIIYDDMDIEIGKIKLRKKGGAGSHNGMKSVIENLKTEEFPRVRIGIGKPKDKSKMIEYVIGPIPKEEITGLEKGINLAKDAVIEFIKNDLDSAMNKYN